MALQEFYLECCTFMIGIYLHMSVTHVVSDVMVSPAGNCSSITGACDLLGPSPAWPPVVALACMIRAKLIPVGRQLCSSQSVYDTTTTITTTIATRMTIATTTTTTSVCVPSPRLSGVSE